MALTSHQNHGQNGLKEGQVVVVMVPFPAQGHLNQLLHLSLIFSSYNIPVHYVGTAIHNRQAKLRVHGWDPLAIANIHFHDVSCPSFLSPPPDPNASTKFPSHLQPLFDATSHLREPIAALLREFSATSRRLVVIHDSVFPFVVQDVATIENAETYAFKSVSAFACSWYFCKGTGRPFPLEAEIQNHLRESTVTTEFREFMSIQQEHMKISSGFLYNACKVIEGPYLDIIAKELINENKKQWAIGPFNPIVTCGTKNSNHRHKYSQWLDKQAPNSVIFVSFGTTTSLSDEQIREIAIGLDESEQKFIWVLRDADRGDVFEGEVRRPELPKRYEERVEKRGMVVRDWAPQLEILGHPSTGGFLSHCGWNSCMEGLTMGVPIAAWPMHSDQPKNAVLITKVLKVGLMVRDWTCRDELVSSSTVEKAVKRLMASSEGDEMRKRASELGEKVRKSVEDGGVTHTELNSFMAHITR